MKVVDRLRFGPAGIPHSAAKRSTVEGVVRVWELGLDAMEMEFVRGVKMSIKSAVEIRDVAKSRDVYLTAHAPYYINLNSEDPAKVKASTERIYRTAKVTHAAGGYSIVFHAAYYGKVEHEKVYEKVKAHLTDIVKRLNDEGIHIWVRPETTGKPTQFGTLEELVRLSEELEMVLPCVDFAHLHARSVGKYNTYEEFAEILEFIEARLGRYALENMHIHVSGINYGPKGEKNHLNLKESDFNYHDLVKVWREFNIKGVVISESPNLEEDALLLKKIYEE